MADKQPADQVEDPTAATAVETNTGNEPEPEQPEKVEGDGNEPGGQGAGKRISQLRKERNKLKEEADHWKNIAAKFADIDRQTVTATNPIIQPTQPAYQNEEVERAFNVLRQRGVATLGDLDEIKRQAELRSKWDKAHFENAQRYNSPGSRFPKYDAEEVEQYGREHGLADPNAAYRDMYFDEIVDAIKSETRGRPAKGLTTEKPTKATDTSREPLTLDNFRAKLAGPDGNAFYEELAKNPAKFDSLMANIVK
jgi:hypothetical protein